MYVCYGVYVMYVSSGRCTFMIALYVCTLRYALMFWMFYVCNVCV